jgi:hypothetical protein
LHLSFVIEGVNTDADWVLNCSYRHASVSDSAPCAKGESQTGPMQSLACLATKPILTVVFRSSARWSSLCTLVSTCSTISFPLRSPRLSRRLPVPPQPARRVLARAYPSFQHVSRHPYLRTYAPTDPAPCHSIFSGDSAGAGLLLSLLVLIRDSGGSVPMPAGACLISPWVDLTHSMKSIMGPDEADYVSLAVAPSLSG